MSCESQRWRYVSLPSCSFPFSLACEPIRVTCGRPYGSPIHILDNDSVLNIFHHYRPIILEEDEDDDDRILEGGEWGRERWWYKLAHVCRRWRYLILASASHLHLRLVCTYGTPVADMLAHSPPLPLVIDHVEDDHDITTEHEEGLVLALQLRDRVRRIRLQMPVPNLKRLMTAIGDEFPVLDYLYVAAPTKEKSNLVLPQAFQAPHLRYLVLDNIICPIGSPLLTPTMGLLTLSLLNIHPSAYFSPNDLLQRLSLMPQLETLGIVFHSPVSNRHVERQLLSTPITAHVTLPSLRWFGFKGASAYLEALLPQMTTPILEKLQVLFFNQLTYPVPHLLQFINNAENLTFCRARIAFDEEGVSIRVYPHQGAKMYTLYVEVSCKPIDWQVASAAQVFNALRTAFLTVDSLTLEYNGSFIPSEWRHEVDRRPWRELLGSFSNVKILRIGVGDDFVGQLSRSLRLEDGEAPLELLPELKELSYSAIDDDDAAFTAFIDARQNSGRPVTLIRRGTSPTESSFSAFLSEEG